MNERDATTPNPAPQGGPPGNRPLSEEQVVDWIDGNVTPEEAAAFARASGRPDLPARVAQMQRHKAVLASLEDEHAPAELYDRVMAAVERDVLLGVPQATAADFVEPRLRIAGDSDGVTSRVSRVVQGNLPRFALAAGLLLMVGGLAYFGSVAYRAAKKPIAPNGVSTLPGENSTGTLAINDQPVPTPDGARSAKSGTNDNIPAQTNVSETTAIADAAPKEVPVERAVQLASEGRLAIRVLAQKPENLSRIERDVSKPKGDRLWRLTRSVPADVVAAVVPARPTSSGVAMAGEHTALSLIGPYIGPGAAMSMMTMATDPIARVKGTFLVDVPATREQLNVVATVFKNQLNARVVFEELPRALDVPSSPQAQDVLWWTQAPSQWTPRATVPLVVEQR